MTRHQYFRDSVEDNEHEYDMQGFARFHARLFGGNGISNTQGDDNIEPYDDFEVTTKGGMELELGSGYAAANGYMLEEDEPQTLILGTSDPDNDRIDRVVLRFDILPESAEFKPVVIKGTPSKNPKSPKLTKNNYTFELYVAQVRVRADRASLDKSDIKDEREQNRLPIDNLQRGVKVDEYGLVSMPNQSYVEVDRGSSNTNKIELPDRENIVIPLTDVEIDRQNEIANQSKGIFKPRANGNYLLNAHLAFSEGDLTDNDSDVQIKYYVNQKYTGMLVARVCAGYKDNIFNGTNTHYLERGDELQFKIEVKSAPDDLKTRNHRITIAKLN